MEEASVAGESPDRSKQRESSEEPTPGSAGPVPEARSEGGAAGKRDPRLPVTRDTSSPSPSSTASASASTSDASTSSSKATASANDRGGVDTATRVLSVRDTQTEGEEAEDSVEAAGSGAAESGSVDSESESDSESTDGKPDGRDDSATEGDGRLHAVVTAWVRSAEEVDQDEDGESAQGAQGAQDSADGDTGAKNGPEDGKDGSVSRDEGSSRTSEGGAADDTGTTGESEGSEESDGADAEDESGSARDTDTDSDAESDSETESEADADTAPEDEAAPAAEDDGDSTSGSADGDDTDASPEPQPEADDEPEGAKAAPEPSSDKADDGDGDDGEGTGDAKPPTDQPTAVFKAPRPSAPAVDQPTTMLKLGDAAKEADKAERVDRSDSKGGAAPEAVPDADPESGPERAGTFVPLKDLDAPETRKPPKRGDSATTSLRLPPSAQTRPTAPPAESTRSVPQVGPELTRQQPLPTKPPLDLLAELTNTPPPPETPARTAVRRVKIWTPLVALLLVVFAVVQAVRPLPTPTLALTAKDTHTFDGDQVKLPWPDEGQGWMSVDGIGAMDHFGEQKPVAIASVTKTMTAYVILRDHPLKPGEEGPKIEIDPTAEKEGGYNQQGESTLNTVKAGEFLTQKQALSAVMIPSANNIARLLARWDAGSEEAFVEKMNATAKELGMTDTKYTDPSGLDKTTVSTAEDQVKLGMAAMRIPAMVAITSVASWTDPTGDYWSNHNQLPYTIGAIGIKTGNTTAAGGNLLFATRKKVDGQTVTIVGAILGQRKAQSTLDLVNAVSKTALLAAQDAPTSEKILKKGDVVGHVDDGLGGRTPVVVSKDVKAIGWSGSKVELSLKADALPHTASAGTKVGVLTVGDGTEGAVEVPVQLQSDLAEPGFGAKLTRLG
ncbi:D-alanyl-D-alanine carboxypeptidase [Streptomyces hirsutus]|uniref:D-alanyl-D-alanine carboxypeptidase n=1 Tax=Streptomyces hirsutus TaxID=35620 RepID=UPI003F4D4F00